MAPTFRTLSIIGACIIAAAMIYAAYAASGGFSPSTANAASTEEALKALATKDTDSDGLPDWQESLYGTDPSDAHSISTSQTDGEAVAGGLVKPKFASDTEARPAVSLDSIPGELPAAGTLTDQFSKAFFEAYLTEAAGKTLTADEQQALIMKVLGKFSGRAAALVAPSYTAASVRTNASVSTTQYTDALEDTLAQYGLSDDFGTVASLSEDFIRNGDAAAGKKLTQLSETLIGSAKGFAAIEVPPALASDHLVLIRSFDILGKIAHLEAGYEQDPVAALGALGAYESASEAILDVWQRLAPQILAEGTPRTGSLAAEIVEISRTNATP